MKDIVHWFIDHYKCWRYGHIMEDVRGTYLYCERCGYFVLKDRFIRNIGGK